MYYFIVKGFEVSTQNDCHKSEERARSTIIFTQKTEFCVLLSSATSQGGWKT